MRFLLALCALALLAAPALAFQEEGRCDCKEIPKAHYKKDHQQKKDGPPKGGKEGDGFKKPPAEGDGFKKPPAEGGDGFKKPFKEGGDKKCGGKSASSVYGEWSKRKDVNLKDLEENVKEHFKQHPDDCCHCLCNHNEGEGFKKPPGDGEIPPPKKIGGDAPPPPKKEGGSYEGKPKKCSCDKPHDGECKKKEGGDPGFKKEGGGDLPPPKKIGGDAPPPPKKEGGYYEGKPKKCSCDKPHDGECKGKEKGKGNNGVGNGKDPQPPGNPKQNDGEGSEPGKPGNKKG